MEHPGSLTHRLAGFFPFLRAREISVGLGAELDLARALEHVDPLDREAFYLASRTTLVKRPEDLPTFQTAFEAYWLGAGEMDLPGPVALPSRPPVAPPPDNVKEAWGTPTFPSGDPRRSTVWMERLRLLVYSPDAPPGRRQGELLDRGQLDSLKRRARQFRRWGATIGGRRRVPSRKGDIDFPRTTRASLRSGGELLAVRRYRRKLQRTRLVVLWDVSGSMEGHGPLLLGIVYALLRAIPSTRLFAFSTDLQPLTSVLRGRSYRDASRLVSEKLERAGGGTQIGRCLAKFQRDHGATVDRRTIVLILSDGWDVGRLDLLESQMATLARRASFLLWVNPYADRPDFRPEVAGLRRALPYLDLMVPPSAFVDPKAFRRWFGPARTSKLRKGSRPTHRSSAVPNLGG